MKNELKWQSIGIGIGIHGSCARLDPMSCCSLCWWDSLEYHSPNSGCHLVRSISISFLWAIRPTCNGPGEQVLTCNKPNETISFDTNPTNLKTVVTHGIERPSGPSIPSGFRIFIIFFHFSAHNFSLWKVVGEPIPFSVLLPLLVDLPSVVIVVFRGPLNIMISLTCERKQLQLFVYIGVKRYGSKSQTMSSNDASRLHRF